jgi:hypothetical protein
MMLEPDDVERDVLALCRAFHQGDQAGAKVLLEANNPLHLITALVAVCNRLGAEQAGGFEAWDAHLGRCLDGTVESR